jgi:hypothetical protein
MTNLGDTMGSVRLFTLGLMALLLAGCGPRLAQMPELPQPPQRIVQYGYSFMPPNEKGWHVAARDSGHIILGRFGPSPDETVMILAGNALTPRLLSRDDFDRFVRAQLAKDASTGPAGRFSDQTTKVKDLRHAGADCERVHQMTIDHMAKKRSGKQGDMTLEVIQMFCRHPDNAGVVTYLSYSQRYYAGNRDPAFDARADRLLDSLEFSKF